MKPDLIGQTIAGYAVQGKLGAGGMGVVYKARHTRLHRLVALKLLRPEQVAHEGRRRRFLQEARAASALNHPGIVTIHDIVTHEGGDVIVMELVDGEPLDQRIPAGGMPWREAAEIALELSEAVAVAHEAGIVHRDLKPANVVVTAASRSAASSRAAKGYGASGRVKVLDFGIAKLMPTADSSSGDSHNTTMSKLTRLGVQPGTPSYMAPEQLLGEPIDPRTDVFAFGVLVYEMLTGRRPFQGQTPVALADEILHGDPTPISELRSDVPEGLATLVDKALAKSPAKRHQSMHAIGAELLSLLTRDPTTPPAEAALKPGVANALVESTLLSEVSRAEVSPPIVPAREPRAEPAVVTPETQPADRRVSRLVQVSVLIAVLVAMALAALKWWPQAPSHEAAAPAPTPAGPAKPTMAVFQFRNLTGDPTLDWLRNGITEMLITDLSQSPEIEVLSTSSLYRISKELGALDDTAPSFELMQAVAEKSGIETMVRGGYARVGERLRISFTLEEAMSGTILESDNVDGYGQDSLFSVVDELSATIRNSFEVVGPAAMPVTVQAVTTSSIEAWRLFTEAQALSYQSKRSEAITLLEKAVELDPNFALALVNLGSLHRNLGHGAKARRYMGLANDLANRLPLDIRYQIQGIYYSNQWATYDEAIEAFHKALELYPDRESARARLARLYAHREQYEQANVEFQTLIDNGTTYPGTYLAAANIHAARGNFETGYRLLSDFARRHPENWLTQIGLGWHLTDWGRFDAASNAYRRAEELRPGDVTTHNGLWRLRVMQEDWEQANLEAEAMLSIKDPFARWRGAVSQARNLLFRGKAEEALAWFDEAINAYPAPEGFTALAHLWKAELLLQKDEFEPALAAAKQAQAQAPGDWPELHGIFLAALAEQAMGHPDKTNHYREVLHRKVSANPNLIQERQLHYLDGLLSLRTGDHSRARDALARTEALLPPRGIELHWYIYPQHIPIWFALGQAALLADETEEAQRWLERAAASGTEHLEEPVPFVRSLFLLGYIHRERGEHDEARRYFERFLTFWHEGDFDLRQVELALAAIAGDQSTPAPPLPLGEGVGG